jgi:hypothetical protein
MNRAILEFLSHDPAGVASGVPLLPAETDIIQRFFPPIGSPYQVVVTRPE